jgi:hypothetical protein
MAQLEEKFLRFCPAAVLRPGFVSGGGKIRLAFIRSLASLAAQKHDKTLTGSLDALQLRREPVELCHSAGGT